MAQPTKMKKAELVKILKANRAKHKRVFTAALEGYRQQAEAELEQRITALRNGRIPKLHWPYTEPEDHTRDYDRVIRMIELDTGVTWTLDETEFGNLVMDDWRWKREFLRTSNRYAAAAVHTDYAEFVDDD
jgi:hypothetical protein